jgi:hypothetical protein
MTKPQTYSVTKDILLNAELPQETKTYKPISHEQLMDLTLNSIQSAGFELGSELYSSARGGNVANGRYTIKNIADSEMELQIGWQNSYDRTMSLKFAIGTKIFICSNGCVSGDYGAFKKIHKGNVQEFAPSAITEYIKSAGEAFRRMQEERDAMKNIEITRKTKAELIGRMIIDEQFIQSTQLNIIEKEMKNPTHDYSAPSSMWELYNYTTFAMKEIHPSLWMQNHQQAHSFFVSEAGILTQPINIEIPKPEALLQLNLF